jgi:nicotinate-nucleotide adenylyltransferase
MHIVVFGGAFDPPHLGHQAIAENVVSQGIADEVWFVPVREHSFLKRLSPPEHRLAMLKSLLPAHCRIETYELESEGINYSFNTLDALHQEYPQHQFSWIIGSDNLAKFHTWGDAHGRSYKELLASYRFYVYPREGHAFEPLYEGMVPLPNMPVVTVSSTQVRAAIESGQPYQHLVTPAIANYIAKQHLYTEIKK